MENVFPQEIIDSSNGFNHEFRQKILSHLILNKEMTYSELKDSTNAKNGNLNHHLHLLQKGSLIGKYVQKKTDDKVLSYYKITDFGKLFIEGMMSPLRKTTSERKIRRQFAESFNQSSSKMLYFSSFSVVTKTILKHNLKNKPKGVETPWLKA